MQLTLEYTEKVRQNLVKFDGHKIGDSSCEGCKSEIKFNKMDKYAWLYYGDFPKVHSCGGYIHLDTEWQGDDGWENLYCYFVCENCGAIESEEFE